MSSVHRRRQASTTRLRHLYTPSESGLSAQSSAARRSRSWTYRLKNAFSGSGTLTGVPKPLLLLLFFILLLRLASRLTGVKAAEVHLRPASQQQQLQGGQVQQPHYKKSKAAAALFNSPPQRYSQPGGLLHDVLSGPSLTPDSSSLGAGKDEICKPTGQIEDACCDYETVERRMNTQRFFDTLSELVKTHYFRYYKVDLFKDCPFWNENGLCMNRACGVETADESEVPEQYRTSHLSSLHTTDESVVFSDDAQGGLTAKGPACSCRETDFCHWEDEDESRSASWVDLTRNPERFTGYAGASASRVWRSIYEENCFGAPGSGASLLPSPGGFVSRKDLFGASFNAPPPGSSSSPAGLSNLMGSLAAPPDAGSTEQCLEKRVFYRLISGLHASISIHICSEFLNTTTGEWSPNLECFVTRIAQHPERLQNVYFNYVLLLRALARAGDYIEAFVLRPGDAIAEPETRTLLANLVQQARACPPSFDEGSMFAGPHAQELKSEFRDRFRNVSRIMDCVGCDKCRLWGKLQVNGLGTALKILFGHDKKDFDPSKNPELLQRSELVALINTVHRFAESLRAVATFREMYQKEVRSAQEPAAAPKSPAPPARKPAAASAPVPKPKEERRTDEATQPSSPSSPSSSEKSEGKGKTTTSVTSLSSLEAARVAWGRATRACKTSLDSCALWLKARLEGALRRAAELLQRSAKDAAAMGKRGGKEEL